MRKATEVRKTEMVDLVERLLIEGGISNVTIHTIAKRSGFSEAAVYRHFKNKQAILQTVADDLEQKLFQSFDDAVVGIDDPREKISRIMQTHLQFTERRHGGLFVVIAACIHANNAPLKKRMLSLVGRYLNQIEALLKDGMARNLVRADIDLRECSLLFFGMIHNAAIYFLLSEYKKKPSDFYKTFWAIFLQGITPS